MPEEHSLTPGSPDVGLVGSVAVVTGGAQGIGFASGRLLGECGARVLLADLDLKAAERAAEDLVNFGCDAICTAVDVRDADSVEAMIGLAVDRWGQLDVLVNSAGVATTEVVAETSEADWRRVLDVNLTGAFLCCRAALAPMTSRGRGRIINVASVAAKRTSFNASAAYTASKAGLVAFTRHLGYEVARDGITVNAICPGPTVTPMMEQVATPETLEARRRQVPRGRLLTPDDQARAVLFLASDLADMICGVALDVDGGALLGWTDVDSYLERRRASRGVQA
jgi:NAD(P)-dependent dehydrogenase (short-subunit alcohol dehydrogenase family)